MSGKRVLISETSFLLSMSLDILYEQLTSSFLGAGAHCSFAGMMIGVAPLREEGHV
jgi:hypothetical protein